MNHYFQFLGKKIKLTPPKQHKRQPNFLTVEDKQAVFLSRRGRRISRNQVYTLTKKYGQLAGIQKNVTPHVLRHTLATNMIAHGASIIEVKEQLGHRSLESTLQYVHLQIDHRKALYETHCPHF